MPKRDEILQNLAKPNGYGVMLMGQLSGAPETLEFVINIGEIDDSINAYREKSSYIIRALGVADHRISLGIFGKLSFEEDHPLLYEHNQASSALFFRSAKGKKQTNELMLDFLQGYASTFRGWKQIPQYLNTNQPLYDMLNSNGDHVGNMPEALAVNLSKVFEKHGCETKILTEELPEEDEHGRSQKYKALIIDDTSYVVALEFTVDSFGK